MQPWQIRKLLRKEAEIEENFIKKKAEFEPLGTERESKKIMES